MFTNIIPKLYPNSPLASCDTMVQRPSCTSKQAAPRPRLFPPVMCVGSGAWWGVCQSIRIRSDRVESRLSRLMNKGHALCTNCDHRICYCNTSILPPYNSGYHKLFHSFTSILRFRISSASRIIILSCGIEYSALEGIVRRLFSKTRNW